MRSKELRQMRAAQWSKRRQQTLQGTIGLGIATRPGKLAAIVILKSIHRFTPYRLPTERLNQETLPMSWGIRTSNAVSSWKKTAFTWQSANLIHSRLVMSGQWPTKPQMMLVMIFTKHQVLLKAPTRTKLYARVKWQQLCLMRCVMWAICVFRTKRKSLLVAFQLRPSPMSLKKPICWVKNSCWTHKSPRLTCVPLSWLPPLLRQKRRSRPLRSKNSPPSSSTAT